jgi:hypothetical protein
MEKPSFQPSIVPTQYKNERAELIANAVKDINELRKTTKYKQETERNLAIRVNSNPFLKSDSELAYILKECENRRNYSHLYYICPLSKKISTP